MEQEIFSVGRDGIRATVFVAVDPVNALVLALAIFLGIAAALALYARVLK